jgi:surface antigen
MVLGLGLSGCETVSEHKPTAIGAGAGAATGAAAGALIGKDVTGAVVGGLVGALAGGAIGYYFERKDKDRVAAAATVGYTGQGDVVRVDQLAATPTTARPGGTVSLDATYTILTPNDQQVTVQEAREVRFNGQLVANPATTVRRTNGTYTSQLPITLPSTAPRGTYEYTITVTAGDRVSRGTTTFQVS